MVRAPEKLVIRGPLGAVEKPVPLADVAFEQLRRELLPGGALFESPRLVEVDLAERLDMSRTPVREALHRLALIGILQAVPGGGYLPRRFTRREIQDHYELRILLEPMAAGLAASIPDEIRARASDDSQLTTDEISADANTRFHKAVARFSGNRSLARIVEQSVDRLAREGVHARGTAEDQARLAGGHAAIVEAIRHGAGTAASNAMRDHLTLALNILLASTRSAATTRDSSESTGRSLPGATDPHSRERLGEGAYQELRAAILDGRLAAGSVLSETSVAQALNVSRTPTRYALRWLEAEGYVDRDDRARLLVHRLTRAELAELFAVRQTVEAQAARLAAAHISEEELDHLHDLLASDLAAARAGDIDRLEELNEKIHAAVLHASRSRALIQVANDVRERVYGFGFSAFAVGDRGHRRQFVEDHAAVARAIRDGEGEEAAAVLERHMASALRLLLAEFDRYDRQHPQ